MPRYKDTAINRKRGIVGKVYSKNTKPMTTAKKARIKEKIMKLGKAQVKKKRERFVDPEADTSEDEETITQHTHDAFRGYVDPEADSDEDDINDMVVPKWGPPAGSMKWAEGGNDTVAKHYPIAQFVGKRYQYQGLPGQVKHPHTANFTGGHFGLDGELGFFYSRKDYDSYQKYRDD